MKKGSEPLMRKIVLKYVVQSNKLRNFWMLLSNMKMKLDKKRRSLINSEKKLYNLNFRMTD